MVTRYRITYDNGYLEHLVKTLWRAPSFKNAILVAEVFKWLIYGMIVGVATAIIAPFLVLYGVRITSHKREDNNA